MIKHAIFCAKELKASLEMIDKKTLKECKELREITTKLVLLIRRKFNFKGGEVMKRFITVIVMFVFIFAGICRVQAMAKIPKFPEKTIQGTDARIQDTTRIQELQQENKQDVELLERLEEVRQQTNMKIIGRNAVIAELRRQNADPKKEK